MKVKKEIIEAMEEFALRVLSSRENENMQEVAILPKILEILERVGHQEDDQ